MCACKALRSAIPSQWLVHYLPQIDQHTGVLGAKVLARWRHSEQGVISPARFIPLSVYALACVAPHIVCGAWVRALGRHARVFGRRLGAESKH